MKRTFLLLILLLFVMPLCAFAKPLRVLFIGNSFTFYNDTPAIFKAFCQSRKIPVEIASSTPGGYSFSQHAKDARTQELLAQKWDWVVLQAQSVEPAYRKNECLRWGKHLAKLATDGGANVLLFNTWGYRHPGTKEFDLDMHNKICRTYCEIALAAKCKLAPCGPAWKYINEKHPELDLYNPNDSNCHPSLQGSYLNACIFFTMITGKPAQNLPPVKSRENSKLSVDKKKAAVLQRIAQQTVKTFSPQKFLQDLEKQNQTLPSPENAKTQLHRGMTKADAEKILGHPFQSNTGTRLFLYKAQNDVIIWVTYDADAKIITAHADGWTLK